MFNGLFNDDVDVNGNVNPPPTQDDTWNREQDTIHPAVLPASVLAVILSCIIGVAGLMLLVLR